MSLSPSPIRSFPCPFLPLAIWTLALAAHAGIASGQPAEQPATPPKADAGWAEIRIVKPDPDPQKLGNMKSNAKKILQTRGATGPATLKILDDYFELYMLPQLTQPRNLSKAVELRDELSQSFEWAARANNQATYDHLNELVFDYLQTILHSPVRAVGGRGGADVLWNGDATNPRYWWLGGGKADKDEFHRGPIPAASVLKRQAPQVNFHPACRYNAMFIMGQLNEKMEWNTRNKAFDVTPLRKALRPMVEAAGDASLPEAVRLAAMLGIQRHIDKGGLPAGAIDLICGVMTRVSKENTTATGHLADGHQWIRRQAINLIGACGAGSTGQDHSTALTDRLVDLKEPLPVRQAAATALARLLSEKKRLDPGDAAELSTKLATLAVDLSRHELDPSPLKQPQFSSRRAGDGFDCVVLALGGKSKRASGQPAKAMGVLHAAPESEQPYVQGLIDLVTALRSACADSPSEAALRGALADGARDISSFIAAGPEAAASGQKKTGDAASTEETVPPKDDPADKKEPMQTNPF